MADSLDEMLLFKSGNKGWLCAFNAVGLSTKTDLLAHTDSADAMRELQAKVADQARSLGITISESFIESLRRLVQDSRLALGGFPDPSPETESPIIFTAPHTLYLNREGHKHHVPERYTSELARSFAHSIKGAFLTWNSREEARNKELFEATGRPDQTNHDPNFTRRSQLSRSPWTRKLREVRERFGPRPCLHVDLHGCKDPGPDGGSHLVVGIRAMEFAGSEGIERFRSELQLALSAVLKGYSVNVKPERFLTGAWEEDDRCTLTQQSLSPDGGAWTHAVQLEMCMSLRRLLNRSREFQVLLAHGIMIAWVLACGDQPGMEWYSARVQCADTVSPWTQRCAEFHERREANQSRRCKKRVTGQAEGTSEAKGRAGSGGVGADEDPRPAEKGAACEEPEAAEAGKSEESDGGTANSEARGHVCEGPTDDLAARFASKTEQLRLQMMEDLDAADP